MIEIPVANIQKNQLWMKPLITFRGPVLSYYSESHQMEYHLLSSDASCLLIFWWKRSKHQVTFIRFWESEQDWLEIAAPILHCKTVQVGQGVNWP